MTHQTLSLGKYWKLFSATLNDKIIEKSNTSYTVSDMPYKDNEKKTTIKETKITSKGFPI